MATYGGPQGVRNDPEAESRLSKKSRARLNAEKLQRVLASVGDSIGAMQSSADARQVQRYAEEALRIRWEIQKSRKRIHELTKDNPVVGRLATIVGRNTAGICWAQVGDPGVYHCVGAYLKAHGLNLKERSSGRYQGQLRITKRGLSRPRRWLYFAAMRHVNDPWIRPWFEGKKRRGKGHAKRALVALMRKLVMAMYRLGADETKTFDVKRLLPGAKRHRPKKNSEQPAMNASG